MIDSDLARQAYAVVFDNDGAVMVAKTAAAHGDVALQDELLSKRDQEMLEWGALAGAAVAIARASEPWGGGRPDAMERADLAMDAIRLAGPKAAV